MITHYRGRWGDDLRMTCDRCTDSPQPKCRRCYRLRWDAANKEHNAVLRRARHLKNRERGLAQRREHYLANREKQLAYFKKRRAEMRSTPSAVVKVSIAGWGCRA